MKRAILALVCCACYAQTATTPKKRIAVLDFDFATVQNNVASIFGTNQDIGKGIADLLVDRLVSDGRYSVVERKALMKVIAEQNFSNSDRADATTAAKLGKLLGVDGIVIGSITQFGRDDQNRTIGGSAFGGLASRYGLGGVGQRKAKAVVGVSARLVNIQTAEILAVVMGKGESKRSGASLIGEGGSWGAGGGGNLNMGGSNFSETLLGEAVANAVNQVAIGLENDESRLPSHVISISGLVADVSGNTLILNVGASAGVRVGDRLAITRGDRVIKDPATGKVIRRIEDPIGQVTITQVDADSSTATFAGAGTPKVGDTAKTPGQ